jgi:acyl-CoA synthetase (AMP-forming)/AMP-acid ligase II
MPGGRVSIWAPNGHRWMVAALGSYRAGATLVPVHSRFKAGEAAGLLRATGAKILFTVTDFLATDYAAAIRAEPDRPSARSSCSTARSAPPPPRGRTSSPGPPPCPPR